MTYIISFNRTLDHASLLKTCEINNGIGTQFEAKSSGGTSNSFPQVIHIELRG